jgi:hypothetical protein
MPGLVGTFRRVRWRGASGQLHRQFQLVVKGDAERAHHRDARFNPAGLVDGTLMDGYEAKPPPLVETEGVQVVVGRYQPEAPAPLH